tara:strand:+ start:247 stop:525 length:279 start_codon:yes stop_codon:yes gene_type:complete
MADPSTTAPPPGSVMDLLDTVMGEDRQTLENELLEVYEEQLQLYSDRMNGAIRTAVVVQNPAFSGVAGPIYNDSEETTTNIISGIQNAYPDS